MKLNVKRSLFCGFFCLLACLAVFLRFPFHLQSSLNDLFPAQINGVDLPKEITDKYANTLNIVVEADSFEKAKTIADNLFLKMTSAGIENITYQVPKDILNQSIDYFKAHQNSFLSQKTRILLKNHHEAEVRENVVPQISTSWMPPIVPLKDDPFLLLSDYIQSIDRTQSAWQEKDGVLWQEKNGKNYIYLFVKMDNKNIQQMINQVLFIQTNVDANIHLSGAPIHTAQMFNQTKLDIFIISLLAFLILFLLTYKLFHNVRSILFVGLNLGIAFLFGTLTVFLFSSSVHFLTFAFGASLVGICVDYSFHRFYSEKNSSELFQNIFYSFLTTVCCFALLLFSDFSLLNQIALFTIGGLCGTFVWVFICPKPQNTKKQKEIKVVQIPFKKVFCICLFVLCAIGLNKARIDHSVQSIYKPAPALQKEEVLFQKLNGENISALLLIKAESLQSVLQKEERLKENFDFFSLSTLLPSTKRQQENLSLINSLYEKEGLSLQTELGLKQIPQIKQTPLIQPADFDEKFSFLTEQFIVKTPSTVWSITPVSNTAEILNKDVFIFKPATYLSEQLDLQATKSYQNLLVSFCLLFMVLLIIYRKKAFKYLFPPVLSCAGTIGLLSLFGQPITFFHLLSLFIVIGVSMDYAIFLFNQNDLYFKPVLFSFLSSFVGFGLLSFVHFGLVAIIGQTITLGLLLAFCITLMMKRKNK